MGQHVEHVDYDAPGLPADWLNAWLAAIGVTVLLSDVKLAWTDEVVPHAVFTVPGDVDLPAAVFERLPSIEDLNASAIARQHPDSEHEFPRNVALRAYRDRARIERSHGGFLLAASVSDLEERLDEANLPHGAFDPTAPRGETLWARALRCRESLAGLEGRAAVENTFAGRARRVGANGLGFDCRRLLAGVPLGGFARVDPIVELLVLCSLRLFPVRGGPRAVRQRGFTDRPSKRGAFRWSCWRDPLDVWAIDAWLDNPPHDGPSWQLVPYSVPPPDVTRAYFSEAVIP